jgi:hypothetical protein
VSSLSTTISNLSFSSVSKRLMILRVYTDSSCVPIILPPFRHFRQFAFIHFGIPFPGIRRADNYS